MSKLEEVATTTRGYTIYRDPNGAGGYRYWSDAIGGGAVVYDSCITSLDEMAEVLRIEYGMGLCALSTPPPEPPLPWLAFDLEAMQRGVEWLRYCAGAEGADSIALACHNVTLTAQLAEARGLLQSARNNMQKMHECEADERVVAQAIVALDAFLAAQLRDVDHFSVFTTIEAAKAALLAVLNGGE